MAPHLPPPSSFPTLPSMPRRTVALAVVLIAVAMDLLDTSVVNVAVPSIRLHLHSSDAQLQWSVAGYTLAFAAVLVSAGRAGDVFGYRRMFVMGVSLFTLASAVCGLAPTPGALVASRIVQGVCAALMVPQATSLIQLMYRPAERGKVMGLMGAIGGGAAAFGPLVGGTLVNADIANASWRPVFLINIPLGLLALVLAARFLPAGRSGGSTAWDVKGSVLIATTLGLTTAGLIEGPDHGWPFWTVALIGLGLLSGIGFYFQQRRNSRNLRVVLIDPSIAVLRTFGVGLAMSLLLRIVLSGILIAMTFILQTELRYSALKAGTTTVFMTFGMIIGVAVVAEAVLPRLGRNVFAVGSLLLLVGLVAITFALWRWHDSTTPWELAFPLVIFGVGLGSIIGPLFAVTLQDVDGRHAGSASGTLEAVEQLGGSLGVVIITGIFLERLNGHSASSTFIWVAVTCSIPVLLVIALTPLLPHHLKGEDELDIEK